MRKRPPVTAPPVTKTVSIETLSDRLDVSPWTIRTWLRQGKVAFFKIGRRVLVREEDVELLLRKHYSAQHYTAATPPGRNGKGPKRSA